MKKSTFLFNLLATTALATSANASVINGDGWSYDSETGVLEVYATDSNQGYADGDEIHVALSSANVDTENFSSIKFDEGITRVGNFNGSSAYYNRASSLSFPSTLKNIDSDAFRNLWVSDVSFHPATSGLNIGDEAFYNISSLSRVSLPGIKSIGEKAFYQGDLVLENLDDNADFTKFRFRDFTAYCPDTSCVDKIKQTYPEDATNYYIRTYTKDENGVYTFDNSMYASLYDFSQESSCGSRGDTDAYDNCVAMAAEYAANNSITTGGDSGSGGSGSGGSGGNVNNNSGSQSEPKRIYTVEEARQAVEAAGTDTVNFRIRYK